MPAHMFFIRLAAIGPLLATACFAQDSLELKLTPQQQTQFSRAAIDGKAATLHFNSGQSAAIKHFTKGRKVDAELSTADCQCVEVFCPPWDPLDRCKVRCIPCGR